MFQETSNSFTTSFESLWSKVLSFIPDLLGALVVLVIGLVIASLLGKLAKKIVKLTKVDQLAEKIGLRQEAEEMGFRLSIAGVLGWLVKWFIIITTIIAVLDILNISQLSSFLERLVLYLPQVIVAVIILTAGLIVGRLANNAIKSTLSRATIKQTMANFLGALAKWAIYLFALMAALVQLGISTSLIQILFTGLIFMIAIAGGLAFGLGGREHAKRVLDWIQKETDRRQ